MKLRQLALLTDENIDPEFVEYLRLAGHDCRMVEDEGLNGSSDTIILERATIQNRVVVTQDSDFGKLIFKDRRAFLGIIFLRPGHLSVDFHKRTWDTLVNQNIDLWPPFIMVAEQQVGRLNIRLRNKLEIRQ